MGGYVKNTFIIFYAIQLLMMVTSLNIDLVPAGKREFCPPRYPGEQIHPLSVSCEVESNHVGWFVMIGHERAPISAYFTNLGKQDPIELYRGMEASYVPATSSSSVASVLNVSVPLRFLPIKIYCGVNFQLSKVLTLFHKMAPDPPTELKFEEKEPDLYFDNTLGDVLFKWKPPMNLEQQVNSYTLRVSSFISPRYKEHMLAETEVLIRRLERDVSYNVSVVAHNCGGTSRSTSIKVTLLKSVTTTKASPPEVKLATPWIPSADLIEKATKHIPPHVIQSIAQQNFLPQIGVDTLENIEEKYI